MSQFSPSPNSLEAVLQSSRLAPTLTGANAPNWSDFLHHCLEALHRVPPHSLLAALDTLDGARHSVGVATVR